MNVLKPHLKQTVETLLQNNVSQHEISRKTGIDRKTIRKLARALGGAARGSRPKFPHGHRLGGEPGAGSPTPATGKLRHGCRAARPCPLGV